MKKRKLNTRHKTKITWKQFGAAVRGMRGDRSIRVFAQALGVSPATLSRIENGKPCDAETFVHIGEHLAAGLFRFVDFD